MSSAPRSRGRRPGDSGTREAILAAARGRIVAPTLQRYMEEPL